MINIFVPTKNRPDVIAWLLSKYKNQDLSLFRLIILDSSDDGCTEEIVKQSDLFNVEFKRFDSQVSLDEKMFYCYKSQYDGWSILTRDRNSLCIEKCVQILSKFQQDDVVAICDKNSPFREQFWIKKYSSKMFVRLDRDSFFENAFWLAVTTGSIFLSEKIVKSIAESDYTNLKISLQGFYGGCIPPFNFIGNNSFGVIVYGEFINYYPLRSKSYWWDDPYKVFAEDLLHSMIYLNQNLYSKKQKRIAIRNHSKFTKVLTFSRLIYYRGQKRYSYKMFKKYRKSLKEATAIPSLLSFFISIIPVLFIRPIIYLFKKQ